MSKDRIEKRVLLRATIKKVWRALSDSAEFGRWFGVRFKEEFKPGARIRGVITPTTVDAQVAKAQKPYEGRPFDITIDQMQPERQFSFRWHPAATEPEVDYSFEPPTLVVFALEEVPNGVMLRITESGFEMIPFARRAKAYQANEQGWAMMVKVLDQYLAAAR